MPSLRERLFGPSKTDRLLAVLEADRRAILDQQTQTTQLLSKMVDAVNAQTSVYQQQLDLLKLPPGDPIVRLMTDEVEARYERERHKARTASDPTTVTPLHTDTLLAELAADIARDAQYV